MTHNHEAQCVTHAAALAVAIVAVAGCADPHRVVSPTGGDELRPAASRQSTTSGRILYDRGLEGDIYSMDDDGNNVIQLTATPDVAEAQPAWAPDGKRVIYGRNPGDEPVAIFIMNADGTGATRLTYPAPTELDLSPRALGKRIVFQRIGDIGDFPSLWTINDDGSDLTRLTNGFAAVSPAPHPGGKLLAFVRDGDIYVMDVETRALTNPTASDAIERDPSWSPNGKQIAFIREIEGLNSDVFVMLSDGTEVTRLTNTPDARELTPRWSPDSKRIAFSSGIFLSSRIWTMDADGTGLNELSLTHTPADAERVGAWAR